MQLNITPVYKSLAGWKSSTFGLTKWSELPRQAQKYISTEPISKCLDSMKSHGPERFISESLDAWNETKRYLTMRTFAEVFRKTAFTALLMSAGARVIASAPNNYVSNVSNPF